MRLGAPPAMAPGRLSGPGSRAAPVATLRVPRLARRGITPMADLGDSPSQKKLYIETVGCQMNVLDSELVVAKLRQEGYELTGDIQEADAILYNTCSVRQHAEDKIYSALGRIKRIKERRPGVKIGVLGCMAQKDQE